MEKRYLVHMTVLAFFLEGTKYIIGNFPSKYHKHEKRVIDRMEMVFMVPSSNQKPSTVNAIFLCSRPMFAIPFPGLITPKEMHDSRPSHDTRESGNDGSTNFQHSQARGFLGSAVYLAD
jgi:hypothetical protein